jgi:hypothetical protein
MKHVKWSIVAIAATLSAAVFAQPTIDGTRDALYGSPIVVQNTQTGFGDSNLGQVDYANGSELDAAYAYVDMSSQTLYLFLAGNLESNFNKLEIFFDTVAGGQNRLRGDNSGVDFGGLNRMGDDGSGNGLTFDQGLRSGLLDWHHRRRKPLLPLRQLGTATHLRWRSGLLSGQNRSGFGRHPQRWN